MGTDAWRFKHGIENVEWNENVGYKVQSHFYENQGAKSNRWLREISGEHCALIKTFSVRATHTHHWNHP